MLLVGVGAGFAEAGDVEVEVGVGVGSGFFGDGGVVGFVLLASAFGHDFD